MEGKLVRESIVTSANIPSYGQILQSPILSMAQFQLSVPENKSLQQLKQMCTQYILLKNLSTVNSLSMVDLQIYYSLYKNIKNPEISNVIYYKVLDQKCDNKETLLNIIGTLYDEFIATNKKEFIFVKGDQATYERLQSIKAEYGHDLSWMIPFPGDWHFF